MKGLLRLSDAIDAVLGAIARFFAWGLPILVIVIVFDVISRKFGFQLNILGVDLGSTRLQELEWHLHSIVYLTWIGFAYIRNTHVRIDVATGHLPPRSQAKLELLGCLIFAAPYILTALPYAHNFFVTALLQNEGSAAPNGLPWRWVPKGFLYFSFVSAGLAVLSVAIRRIVFLFGPPDLAEEAMPTPATMAH
ncbi:MAG: TRAP transporter small permease subunit [Hyphomicrobiaceae bacterium]|nr:TRAP transporter small permease subunit [Hyphomicrobiaceae bacterium]